MKTLLVKISTSNAEVKWAYNCSQNSNFYFLQILQYGVDEDCTALEQPCSLVAALIKQETSIFRKSNNFASSSPLRIILNVRVHSVENEEFLVVLSGGVYSYR
jgi:hypothetical protein